MQTRLPNPTTIFTCTNCNTEVNEGGDNDTIFMILPGQPSVPHMPCKRCRPLIEAHNAPYLKMEQEAEDRKRAARLAAKAGAPDGPSVHEMDSSGTRAFPDSPAIKVIEEMPEPEKVDMLTQALLSISETQKKILELLSVRPEAASTD